MKKNTYKTFLHRIALWILITNLFLGATSGCAETIVIEDCEKCEGHLIEGNDAVSVVSGMHDITLCGALIDTSEQESIPAFLIAPGAEVLLTLEEESILVSGDNCAGIQVPEGAKLCIMENSSGSVTAWGGKGGAGIGGGAEQKGGEIRICGGNVIAKARSTDSYHYYSAGAGIGGGMNGGYETIAISGGTVYVEGCSAGIGGDCFETYGIIEINGGVVYVHGDYAAAAIGSASKDSKEIITVTGGVVYANNNREVAIGCNNGTIRFDGGFVYVIGDILSDSENGGLIVTNGVVSKNGTLLTRNTEY